ncbi:MAG: hypothetical protein IM506_20280 [Microcystis sp. M19BS1]|nr:hypothetical protein [Microcystis sp. M19BS1]
MVNYRYRLSRLLIPGGIPDPEIGEVELFLASDRQGYVNNIALPPDPNCLEINCTPTQCVERIGIWSNQALGPLGTEGFFPAGKPFFIAGKVDNENRVTVINVGVVCPLTGTPGRSNYALYPQKQGTLELTTPLIPGLPYAEVVRVSPTAGEFLLRYYKTQGLPHAQLGIARSLANQTVDTEELAWAIIGMVGASIRPDANVIYRSSEIDATVSEYVRRACTGLLELMDPGSLPGRRGSIPRFVYSLSSEADIYGPEAEKLQALTEIRVVENCSDCIEVGPNNKRVSREVRDRSCAAVLLALCIAGYGDKVTPLAEYLVSRIDSRGRMITGWTDARPLSTSLSLDSPTASGTITAALAILAYSRVDRSYLPHAHRLIESARLYYYTSSWGTDAIDITLGALISRVLVNYADTPSQVQASLTNIIGQAGTVSPTFLALQLELVGDVNLNTTYRAILDNDPTLECGLSLARELSSTSFLGVLDELGPLYRNYLYRIDKTMSRVRGALPTDFGLFSKTAIRSGNLGRILEAIVPSISAAYNKPLVVPTAPTKVPVTISGILNWLMGLGYQEVYVTEAWREALHVVGNLPTYGNTTLGTGLLGMPRPSARVGVLGRWEERINPAPGGVLVIREGNILGTGTIDDIPAAGALVPDDEECNICYWFGICETPESYGCLAGQFDFCPFELLFIYCPGVLPDRPAKIIEVNQSAIYCPGVLPDRPAKIIEVNQSAVYCPGQEPKKIRYRYPNENWQEIAGESYSTNLLPISGGGYPATWEVKPGDLDVDLSISTYQSFDCLGNPTIRNAIYTNPYPTVITGTIESVEFLTPLYGCGNGLYGTPSEVSIKIIYKDTNNNITTAIINDFTATPNLAQMGIISWHADDRDFTIKFTDVTRPDDPLKYRCQFTVFDALNNVILSITNDDCPEVVVVRGIAPL